MLVLTHSDFRTSSRLTSFVRCAPSWCPVSRVAQLLLTNSSRKSRLVKNGYTLGWNLPKAELKHGRICMMAWAGYVAVDLGLRVLPVPEALEGVTAATAHDASVEQGGLSQMFLWFSLLEVLDLIAIKQMLDGSGRAPGDFGLDGGLLKGKSAEYVEDMKLKEITHCRLAMLAFSGVVTQSVLTQGPFPYV